MHAIQTNHNNQPSRVGLAYKAAQAEDETVNPFSTRGNSAERKDQSAKQQQSIALVLKDLYRGRSLQEAMQRHMNS